MQNDNAPSWGELLSGRNGLRSIALAGGVALHAINVYIATTILPSVVEDIGGLEYYAWNTTLFVAASILGSALSPKTMHLFGPRRAFLVVIALFALGTAICASAPTMGWMLVGRTVQGFGGGLLLGLSYSSIRLVFEERLWPLATGLTSSMWGVATLSGPAIGGLFAETGHWRWAFWTVIPVCFGLAALVSREIAAKGGAGRAGVRVPLPQIALLVASVLVISVASLSHEVQWNAAGLVAGLLIGLGVAWLDKHGGTRLGPLVSTAALASLAVLMPMTGLHAGNGGVWWMLLPLLGVGLGIGLCWPHLLTRVFKASPAGEESMASSAVITIQLYAMALGATLGGMVTNAAGFTQPGGLEGAQQAALALFAIFLFSPAAAAFFMHGVLRRGPAQRRRMPTPP